MSSKVALVTGASRGIGLGIAQRLSKLGYEVAIVARSDPRVVAATAFPWARAGSVLPIAANVGSPSEMTAAVARAVEEFGRLDVLVNNAGVAPRGRVAELEASVFEELLATNVRSVFYATKAAWPHLASTRGVVVSISSMSSIDPFLGMGTYGATKAWVNLLTHALGAEGREAGVRAYAIAPGAVETKLMRDLWPDEQTAMDPGEVADVVESLLDSKMARASGETIFLRT
ncbi:MAG: SDR family oxidoreductase [Deltaproteobacteria bacterium]|nr:SDR family oxidoreductase [Deltaproteobacteria bacterium]